MDMFALLDHRGIGACKGVGVSGGSNVLLHMATKQPKRVKAMVLVSATPYYPAQARSIMTQYGDTLARVPGDGCRILADMTTGFPARAGRPRAFCTSGSKVVALLLSEPARACFR